MTELALLLLRLALIGLLYVFLLAVLSLVVRDLSYRASPAAQPGVGRLMVLNPGSSPLLPGLALPLEPQTTLGRGPGNTVVLEDDFVSTEHALIELRGDTWWLQDLGSTNGTVLNRRRVAGKSPLAPGDVISLGGVRLKFAL